MSSITSLLLNLHKLLMSNVSGHCINSLNVRNDLMRLHCGLKCALGGSLGINIAYFPLHCSSWNIQSEKLLSAYFQMIWDNLYPILTHFYWIKHFISLDTKEEKFQKIKWKILLNFFTFSIYIVESFNQINKILVFVR